MRPSVNILALLLLATEGLLVAGLGRQPVRRGAVEPMDTGFRVDLNRADVPTLRLLPGVGPSLAHRIIDHRLEHGPFSCVDELARVKGLGPATVARIRLFAVCSDAGADILARGHD